MSAWVALSNGKNAYMTIMVGMVSDSMSDYRGIPTPVCPCGSNLIRLTATFDDETYEISGYFLDDASCAECGSLVTAPTPLDVLPT
jgi:hypothetical protein